MNSGPQFFTAVFRRKGRLSFFLIAAVVFALNSHGLSNPYDAHEVFEKCKARAAEIDSNLSRTDIQFTQRMEMESRSGERDSLVFRITVRHGRFERRLVFSSVPNGNRFNGGYDAFDKMFLLSHYFSDEGKVLTSCDFDRPTCDKCYGINFSLSKTSDRADPLSMVSASVNAFNYTPVHIKERIKGLPLGVEFEDNVDIAYDRKVDMYFPNRIVMQVYARFLFLKGEIATVTIENEDLKKI